MTAKFIKLNEANGRMSRLLLNVLHIGAIQSGNEKDTYVRMSYITVDKDGKLKTEYYFVKETFDRICSMLMPGYIEPLNGA